jgi:hypothetical protein
VPACRDELYTLGDYGIVSFSHRVTLPLPVFFLYSHKNLFLVRQAARPSRRPCFSWQTVQQKTTPCHFSFSSQRHLYNDIRKQPFGRANGWIAARAPGQKERMNFTFWTRTKKLDIESLGACRLLRSGKHCGSCMAWFRA